MKLASTFGGALLGLCLATGSAPVWATPVVEFGSQSVGHIGLADGTSGWSFTTNQAITVTALDAWTGSLTFGSRTVRLYDASSTVLASALISSSDPITGAPATFYSQSIAPVALLANTTYYIVEDLFHSDAFAGNVGAFTVNPAITYLGAIADLGAGGFPTDDGFGGAFGTAYFGPNFEIAAASAPEPESYALLLAGLGLLGLARRAV